MNNALSGAIPKELVQLQKQQKGAMREQQWVPSGPPLAPLLLLFTCYYFYLLFAITITITILPLLLLLLLLLRRTPLARHDAIIAESKRIP